MSAATDQNFGRLATTPTKPKGKGGRQSTYTDDMAQRICDHIASGGYATDTQRFGLPHVSTINKWLGENEAFAAAYARARQARAETFAEQIVEIADTCDDPQKGRLQVEARKWVASKLLPRVYGENQRVEVQHTISETAARVLADLAQRQKERKRLEAQCIDVTPEHSPEQGVLTPAISTGCEDAARIAHGSDGQDEGPVEPPRGATTGGPPLQKQPSLSAKSSGKTEPSRSSRRPRKN